MCSDYKRLCVDTSYLKPIICRIKLVDVSKTPIDCLGRRGHRSRRCRISVDAVVSATGFAAMTGPFDKIRVTGRNGLTLAEKWRRSARLLSGVASVGFPTGFALTGPGSPRCSPAPIQAI